MRVFVMVLVLVLVLVSGCSPTFAPPIRTGVSSTPIALAQGQAASVLGWSGDIGHLRVLNRLGADLDLESSVVARAADGGSETSFLLLGPGLVFHQPTKLSWFKAALSVGLAAGCGGVREGLGGCKRGAGGLSVGADLAVGELWGLHLYSGNRLQLSLAQDVPATLWGLHALGIQWDAWDGGLVSLELDPWWYVNRVEQRDAAIVTLGIGLIWDAQ